MKTSSLNVLLIIILNVNFVFSQDKIELSELGFSMNYPEDWFAYNKNQIISNFKQFEFNKDEFDRFSKQVNKSIDYITLTKYEKGKYLGAIPTINIRVDKNPTKDIFELQKDKNMFSLLSFHSPISFKPKLVTIIPTPSF